MSMKKSTPLRSVCVEERHSPGTECDGGNWCHRVPEHVIDLLPTTIEHLTARTVLKGEK